MPPPPPKLGQRDLFNDTFFSFLRRKDKSQPAPPPAAPQSSADSQNVAPLPAPNGHGREEGLGEKKALLQDGHRILDSTKDMLEMNGHLLRKETLKRLRKQAAKLTKSAPKKSKLPKNTLGDVSNFQESAKTLYQEVDNIIREIDHSHGQYPGLDIPNTHDRPHDQRSRSESPPPLPRKPPSPKVTFHAEMKQEPNGNLSRHQSVRRGYELTDAPVPPSRQESIKPSSSSRQRDKEAELARGSSQRDRERRDEDYYKRRDDPRRTQTHRYERPRDESRDQYKDRDYHRSTHSRHHSDSRDYSSRADRDRDRDYYSSRRREDRGDRDRDRYRERGDRDRDRDREKDGEMRRTESSRNEEPQRVVHPDMPLSTSLGVPGQTGSGVPVAPTYVDYPDDEERRRRREREKYYKEREYRDRDRDRDRERGDRDRDRDKYYHNSRKEEDPYRSSRDKYKSSSSRRYDDEYRSASWRDRERERERGHRERDRDRDPERNRGDRDRDRDRDRDHRDRERRERDRGDRDRDREREKRPHEQEQVGDEPPLSPTDPTGSKFQEVFSPPEHLMGVTVLPPSENGG